MATSASQNVDLSVLVHTNNTSMPFWRDELEHADSEETEGANGLLHKWKNLTAASDASSSLHSPIDFHELKMNCLVGGGGFGQVWSAIWRGIPWQ